MTSGERTKRDILEMGLRLWRAGEAITARRIARELNLAHGTVSYHFRRGDHSLRDAVAFHCVEQGETRIIAALIAERHKAVSHMDDATRLEFMRQAAG